MKHKLIDNELYERKGMGWLDWTLIVLGIVAIIGAAATLIYIALHPVAMI